jgi:hypothetical protein
MPTVELIAQPTAEMSGPKATSRKLLHLILKLHRMSLYWPFSIGPHASIFRSNEYMLQNNILQPNAP